MIRALILSTALSLGAGQTFTMCSPDAPVPPGCCEPGDRLDVYGLSERECIESGGVFTPHHYLGVPALDLCEDVDF